MTTETQEKVIDQVPLSELLEVVKDAIAAQKKMAKASKARFDLPAGSSRARVTTANARHATACEAYDRRREILKDTMRRALENGAIPYHDL